MTTFVLSCVYANLVPDSVADVFLTLGLFYGGLAQRLSHLKALSGFLCLLCFI
ncbi:MAG: hypothetical protein ACQEWV_22590 [Bacillota bacterium]